MDSNRATWVFGACTLIALISGLPAVAAQQGDKHTLKAAHRTGEVSRVEVAVQVGGDLKVIGDDAKQKDLLMSVVANLVYDEALLALDPQGRPNRSARHYADARAVIKIDKGGEKPALDASRRLVIAERPTDAPALLYSPKAPLVREELDLIDVPGNTLVLDEMLPTEPVKLGESWKVADSTLAALLCLDAVSWSDVQGVLGEVKDGMADIAAAGSVSGGIGGIATEIELKAKYKFDVKQRKLTQFALLIKEKRSIGHIGPGLDTVAKVLMKISPLASSPTLTSEVIASLPKRSAPELLELGFSPPGGQFQFNYDRRWYVTGDDPKLAVLRLLDKGELVAQCNVSALPKQAKPATLADYQRDVERSLGKNFGHFVSAGEAPGANGYQVFRVVVRGVVSQLPIEWVYYLIQDEEGHRVSLAFTLEEELRDRFGEADRTVVSAIRLTNPPTPTAAKPNPADGKAAPTASQPATAKNAPTATRPATTQSRTK